MILKTRRKVQIKQNRKGVERCMIINKIRIKASGQGSGNLRNHSFSSMSVVFLFLLPKAGTRQRGEYKTDSGS